jgi:hypothetical protein
LAKGAKMSAKPNTKIDYNESISSKSDDDAKNFEGQDVFIEDDPATTLEKKAHDIADDVPHRRLNVLDCDLRLEKLTYIHQMLGELRKLSVTLDAPMVAYLIEMALLEADTALNAGQFSMELGKKEKGMPSL